MRVFLLSFFLLIPMAAFAVDVIETPPPQQLEQQAKANGWTFEYKAYGKKFYTGLLPDRERLSDAPPSRQFLERRDVELKPKRLLSEFGALSKVINQLVCGSCVYASQIATILDTFAVRGLTLPVLSMQWVMDCVAREWRCNGSYFEKVAPAIVAKNGVARESDYPYRAANQACKPGEYPLEAKGKFLEAKLIDPSAKSIMTALETRHAVSVVVAANGPWSSYSSGTYNSCSASAGINHQVTIVGYDAEGDLTFDSKGMLPAGRGKWLVKNSWGENWGDGGYIWMKMTDKQGRKCNSIADEAGIYEVTQEPKPECEPQPVADAGQDKILLIEGK